MPARDRIITLANSHLRDKSLKVRAITSDVKKIISQMKASTLDWEASRKHEVGVALAAIQIDEPLRIIIVRQNFEDKKNRQFDVIINPKIVKLEGELEDDYEGCLSVPDVYGKVPRHTKVRVRALDENGQEIKVKAEGFLARVLQHEVDHTDGILFIDHLKGKTDAFFKLTYEGKLEQVAYEDVKKTGIFR